MKMNKTIFFSLLITLFAPFIISCSDDEVVITQEIIDEPATGVSIDITYEYDDLNRVTKATYSNGQTVIYSYDDAGNITTKILTSNK